MVSDIENNYLVGLRGLAVKCKDVFAEYNGVVFNAGEQLRAAVDEIVRLRTLVACHEGALDGALAALSGSGICTPVETFKRAPTGSLGTCIRELRDQRDSLRAIAIELRDDMRARGTAPWALYHQTRLEDVLASIDG